MEELSGVRVMLEMINGRRERCRRLVHGGALRMFDVLMN